MATPFLSEIKIMSFGFPPKGWALANGQLLPINQNQPLFALLGTTYGGNGQTTFALPNFQGKIPIHFGGGHTLGETGGEQSHSINLNELPQHTHGLQAAISGTATSSANNNLPGNSSPSNAYTNQEANQVALNPSSVTSIGGSQPHLNMQPYLTVSFCIALQGVFPSQN